MDKIHVILKPSRLDESTFHEFVQKHRLAEINERRALRHGVLTAVANDETVSLLRSDPMVESVSIDQKQYAI